MLGSHWSWFYSRSALAAVLLGLTSIVAGACGGPGIPAGSSEDEGIIRLTLSAVPADVACIRVTVSNGPRTVTRNLSATPGQTINASLSGLPTGLVSISADAFAVACPATGATATWTSDPLTVTLVPGVPLQLQLTMRRNGRIDLTIDWADDPGVPNLMFVTSQQFSGDLGGVAGADARCQLSAQGAGLPGQFVAFVSTSAVSLQSRLGSARGWVRTDGRPFADTAADVLAGRIFYPPLLSEFGQFTIASVGVSGCADWTTTSSTIVFAGGWTTLSGFSFRSGAATSCAGSPALYCFEVARNVAVQPVASVPHRLAFLSRQGFVPAGGLAAADLQCGADAVAAGLSGSYRALLATSTASAISRFDLSGPPWALPNGVMVAPTAAALLSDPLAHIDARADGTHAAEQGSSDFNIPGGPAGSLGPGAWTGADRLDTPSSLLETCQDWTSSSVSQSGNALRLANSAPGWQVGGNGWSTFLVECTTPARLFCLQQ